MKRKYNVTNVYDNYGHCIGQVYTLVKQEETAGKMIKNYKEKRNLK